MSSTYLTLLAFVTTCLALPSSNATLNATLNAVSGWNLSTPSCHPINSTLFVPSALNATLFTNAVDNFCINNAHDSISYAPCRGADGYNITISSTKISCPWYWQEQSIGEVDMPGQPRININLSLNVSLHSGPSFVMDPVRCVETFQAARCDPTKDQAGSVLVANGVGAVAEFAWYERDTKLGYDWVA